MGHPCSCCGKTICELVSTVSQSTEAINYSQEYALFYDPAKNCPDKLVLKKLPQGDSYVVSGTILNPDSNNPVLQLTLNNGNTINIDVSSLEDKYTAAQILALFGTGAGVTLDTSASTISFLGSDGNFHTLQLAPTATSNTLSIVGSDLVSTVNGVSSSVPLSSIAAPPPATTNALVGNTANNTITSTVNGVVAQMPVPTGTIASDVGFDASGNIVRQISSPPNIITFNANGTYTPTPGVKYVEVKAIGGGGGGGGVAASNAGNATLSSSGGGGGYANAILTPAQIGASLAVVIGTGGLGGNNTGTNGAAGGNTTVGTIMTANGGLGGPGGTNAQRASTISRNGAAGGAFTVSVGNTGSSRNGEDGGVGVASVSTVANTWLSPSSGGDAGAMGTANRQTTVTVPSTTGAGNIAGVNSAANTGSGGGGAASVNGGAGVAGGNGGSGKVVIIEYFN